MTRFATFATLYMAALFLELAEKWRYPGFTAGILLLGVALLFAGLTRKTFFLFLAVATSHSVMVQFPDVANHVNVEIYCNLLMMVGIAYSLVRSREFPTDDDYFEMTRPVLQATMILVYAVAGFDKLNADFLNPDVSCVRNMMSELTRMAQLRPFGIPNGLVLVAGMALVPSTLFSLAPMRRSYSLALRVGAAGVVMTATLLALELGPAMPPVVFTSAITAMAVMVILWELAGGLLLAIPRFQAPVLAFSWAMHTTLSFIGFVDFGALALALLFTFVPPAYQNLTAGPVGTSVGGRPVSRAQLYFIVCIASGVYSGLHRRVVAALFFNLAVLILSWPMLAGMLGRSPRLAWIGVGLDRRRTPVWLFAFPALLLLHGLTPYLGLRTAGNFSMFSNLRTEGIRSNHLLLGSNPLKLWGYQEDVVQFTHIDDEQAAIGYNYQPLDGQILPVVEFRKLIYKWTRAGARIPMTFEYRGRVYSTADIVHDPIWRAAGQDWEMRLMDFRVIQRGGANLCRW